MEAPPYAVEQALKRLGTNLRTARLRRNLTIQDMAAKIGTGSRAIADAEKGKPSAAIATYAALLGALDLLPHLEDVADPTKDMRLDEIQFERAEWRIPETKNGDPLTVPLSLQAIEILDRRRLGTNSEWVFPVDNSKSGHFTDPKRAWQRVLARAGIKDLRIHDLRRSLGSWQASTGASGFVIGKSLGHKSQQATQIYARLNLDPVRESIERATKAMMSAGKSIRTRKERAA